MYTHDNTFFDSGECNSKSWYWAGFLAADGCVAENKNTVILELCDKDRLHVAKFRRAIKASNPIREVVSRGYVSKRIEIHNARQIIEDLSRRYNIVPRKSLILKAPIRVRNPQSSHFIRGYFDGDGCVYFDQSKQRYVVGFAGTRHVLEWIRWHIELHTKISIRPSIRKQGSIYTIEFKGPQVMAILNWLYQESSRDCRLDRKFKTYQSARKFYGRT